MLLYSHNGLIENLSVLSAENQPISTYDSVWLCKINQVHEVRNHGYQFLDNSPSCFIFIFITQPVLCLMDGVFIYGSYKR